MRTVVPKQGGILRMWEPGESGNPKGRPTAEQRMLKALIARHPDALTGAVDAWAAILRDPDHKHWMGALREALSRVDGPATETGDKVSSERVLEILEKITLVIRAELEESVAERVVAAIRDALQGVRTIDANVVDTEPD